MVHSCAVSVHKEESVWQNQILASYAPEKVVRYLL